VYSGCINARAQSFGVISVAHAQNAFRSLLSSRDSEITSPHFLFAGTNDVIE